MDTEQFRFDNGHLYELNDEGNAYIHCFCRAGLTNKEQAIAIYQASLDYEQEDRDWNRRGKL
ncbi:MAG: hypothetical protein BMS9Abin31_0486 [Gammaproteobacteria bacterium]|nr:MAG: hypothetical protein BMS9Abin31_0486 [Gammaproteobacteria bacterium]